MKVVHRENLRFSHRKLRFSYRKFRFSYRKSTSLRNCPNCCERVSKPTVKKPAKFKTTVSINHWETVQIAASRFLNLNPQWKNRPNSSLQFLSASFYVPERPCTREKKALKDTKCKTRDTFCKTARVLPHVQSLDTDSFQKDASRQKEASTHRDKRRHQRIATKSSFQ